MDELEAERQRVQQPDVALVWDWTDEQRQQRALAGATEKLIIVHNRSGEYVYNVQIEPIQLKQALAFDAINEIAPGTPRVAVGRWDGRSSIQTNYVYFFAANEKEVADKGWFHKKEHNRGISAFYTKVPMALTYEAAGVRWRCEFDFHYDVGGESWFTRKGGKSLVGSLGFA